MARLVIVCEHEWVTLWEGKEFSKCNANIDADFCQSDVGSQRNILCAWVQWAHLHNDSQTAILIPAFCSWIFIIPVRIISTVPFASDMEINLLSSHGFLPLLLSITHFSFICSAPCAHFLLNFQDTNAATLAQSVVFDREAQGSGRGHFKISLWFSASSCFLLCN